MTHRRSAAWALAALVALTPPLSSQASPPDIAQERAAYAAWLATAPNSPARGGRAAADRRRHSARAGRRGCAARGRGRASGDGAQRRGDAFGRGGNPRGAGRPAHRARRLLDRVGRCARAARRHRLRARAEDQGRGVLRLRHRSSSSSGRSRRPRSRPQVRVLALDGIEVDAVEAGTVVVPFGGRPVTLRVRRIPTGEDEVGAGDLFPRRHQRSGDLSRRAVRLPRARPARDAIASTSIARAIRSAPTAPRSPAPRRGEATRSRPRSRRASSTWAAGSTRLAGWRRSESRRPRARGLARTGGTGCEAGW